MFWSKKLPCSVQGAQKLKRKLPELFEGILDAKTALWNWKFKTRISSMLSNSDSIIILCCSREIKRWGNEQTFFKE